MGDSISSNRTPAAAMIRSAEGFSPVTNDENRSPERAVTSTREKKDRADSSAATENVKAAAPSRREASANNSGAPATGDIGPRFDSLVAYPATAPEAIDTKTSETMEDPLSNKLEGI